MQSHQSSSVQSLSHVWLFVTPWVAAHEASLSITNSQSSLRLTAIESVMPSSHLILRRPLLLLTPIPPSIRVFSNESTLRMRWPKYLRANRSGHKGNCDRFLFLWVPKPLHCDWSHEVKRHLLLGGKAMTNPDNICNQRHHFAGKGPYNQGMVFPSSRAWMWDLNHKEGWKPINWCFRTVVLEKTLESFELQTDQRSQS